MKSDNISRKELAAIFDHTNLKASATEQDFEKLCRELWKITLLWLQLIHTR